MDAFSQLLVQWPPSAYQPGDLARILALNLDPANRAPWNFGDYDPGWINKIF